MTTEIQPQDCNEGDNIATVKHVAGNEVTLEVEKKGACKSCAINMLCMGSENKTVFTLKSNLDLKAGDRVRLHISTGSRLLSSFVVFIFPIIVMVCFYFMARYMFSLKEDYAIISSIFGLLLSGLLIKIIDIKLADKIDVKIIERI
jgi:positive regulator of sigma E activity